MSVALLIRAVAFAADKHRHQRRKDVAASPYINHPVEAMAILSDEAGIADLIVLAAAVLHDTLEDTETTVAELQAVFGAAITAIVVELTDDQSLPRADRYRLQQDKATRYSPEAKLIRLADKIANLRDVNREAPPKWSAERKAAFYAQSYALAQMLRGANSKLDGLFAAVWAAKPSGTE